MVKKRVLRTGDGTHKYAKIKPNEEAPTDNNNDGERDTEHFWGWGKLQKFIFDSFITNIFFPYSTGDKEMTEEDMKNVEILHKVLD